MNKQLLRTALWGFLLWLFGYILGIALFFAVPPALLGWVIMPIGIAVTLFVLLKKIKAQTMREYLTVGIVWAVTAVVCDYFLLVRVFKPADGYYKLDVYIYYLVTLFLPVAVYYWKKRKA